MHWLNISHIVEATEAEGPGLRFVIWVQGCLKRCKGCCNGELLKIKPAHLMRSNEIIQLLKNATEKYPLEGLTFLGGEPFLQAKGLADIGYNVSKHLWFYGFKVHMLVSLSGHILNYVVTPATVHNISGM